MLDQLVESRNDGQKAKRGGFLLTTGILVLSLFASGILWSLFAKDLGGNENLELSTLVSPVKLPEEAPPPPEPVKPNKPEQAQKAENSLPVRNDNIARMDENQPTPDQVSVVQNTQRERPKGNFVINPNAQESEGSSNPGRTPGDGQPGTGISNSSNSKPETAEIEEVAPDLKKKDAPKVEPKNPGLIKVSKILNGQATSLPKPPYPAPAKAVRASGDVNVQVTIDEQGRVIAANAVSGHALLKQAAENAARGARFTPTILNGQPVKVTGIIVYKFAMQ